MSAKNKQDLISHMYCIPFLIKVFKLKSGLPLFFSNPTLPYEKQKSPLEGFYSRWLCSLLALVKLTLSVSCPTSPIKWHLMPTYPIGGPIDTLVHSPLSTSHIQLLAPWTIQVISHRHGQSNIWIRSLTLSVIGKRICFNWPHLMHLGLLHLHLNT